MNCWWRCAEASRRCPRNRFPIPRQAIGSWRVIWLARAGWCESVWSRPASTVWTWRCCSSKQAGMEVMVANPRAVRHFAQALMQRSKTDPLDALMLLEFAARMPFQPWQPPSAAALHLCALARRTGGDHRSVRRGEEPPARRQRCRKLCPPSSARTCGAASPFMSAPWRA